MAALGVAVLSVKSVKDVAKPFAGNAESTSSVDARMSLLARPTSQTPRRCRLIVRFGPHCKLTLIACYFQSCAQRALLLLELGFCAGATMGILA